MKATTNIKTRRPWALHWTVAAICAVLIASGGCKQATVKERAIDKPADSTELKEYTWYAVNADDFSVDTLLMLTEEYFDEKSDEFKEEYAEYEQQAALYSEGEIDEPPAAPAPDYSFIIDSYSTLLKKYPAKAGMDSLLYTLGYALYEQGRISEAIEVFEDYVDNYTQTELYPEVAFRLGELYFDLGHLDDALSSYKKILNLRDTVFYTKALYKIAWTHYKMEDYDKAMVFFVELVDELGGDVDEASSAMSKEGLDAIVLCLSQMSIPEEVAEKIDVIKDRSYAGDTLISLAKKLNEQTRHEEAMSVIEVFIDKFPAHESLPSAYAELANTLEGRGETERALEVSSEMVERFNPDSTWYKAIYRERDSRESMLADRAVSEALLKLASHYHEVSKERDDPEVLLKAIDGYKDYLRYYPDSENAKEIYLLLGEAAFESRSYADAAVKYERTMELFAGESKGEEAAFAALLSIELVVSGASSPKEDVVEIDEDVVDVEDTASRLVRIRDFFAEEFTESSRVGEFLIKCSDLLLALGYYEEARQSLSSLLDGPSAFEALRRTAEIYLLEDDPEAAIVAFNKALEINDDQAIKNKLAKLYYVKASGFFEDGDEERAIREFNKVFNLSPKSRVAEDALINIGYIYTERGDMKAFRSIASKLKRHYGTSSAIFKLYLESAKRMEKAERFDEAAELYEQASRYAEDESDAENLVFMAARVLEDSGKYDKAALLLGSHLSSGTVTRAGRPRALFRIGELNMLAGDTQAADISFRKLILEAGNSTDDDMVYVAKAKFSLAEEKLENFLELEITQPFERSLKLKEAVMKELLDDYTYVLKSKVAELQGTAFHKMGRVFENFRDSLIYSERPKDLTKEELEEYNFLLTERAYPLEENAVKAYESAIKASAKHDDPITIFKAVERLARLRPALYKRELTGGSGPLLPPSRPAVMK